MRVSCRLSGVRTPYPLKRALSPLQGDTNLLSFPATAVTRRNSLVPGKREGGCPNGRWIGSDTDRPSNIVLKRQIGVRTPYPQAGPFPLSGGHKDLSFPAREGGPAQWLVDRFLHQPFNSLLPFWWTGFYTAPVRTTIFKWWKPGLRTKCSIIRKKPGRNSSSRHCTENKKPGSRPGNGTSLTGRPCASTPSLIFSNKGLQLLHPCAIIIFVR